MIVVAVVVDLGVGGIPAELTALAAAVEGQVSVAGGLTSTSVEPAALRRGIYFGWITGAESHFLLAGAPCEGAAHPQLAELYGGDLLPSRLLPGSALSSFQAPLDAGRELSVTALSSTALMGLLAAANDASAVTTATTPVLSFSRLRARCRDWHEIDSDLGSAEILLLPANQFAEPEPVPTAGTTSSLEGLPADGAEEATIEEGAIEAHSLPLPERSALLALLLLWNRTSTAVVLDAIHYAPSDTASDRILAASGTFDRYDELEALILRSGSDRSISDPGSTAAPRRSAANLDLVLEPGGIALLGIDRGAFTSARLSSARLNSARLTSGRSSRPARSAGLVLLSYPLIDYHSLRGASVLTLQDESGGQPNQRAELAHAVAGPPAKRLAMTSPLYARW